MGFVAVITKKDNRKEAVERLGLPDHLKYGLVLTVKVTGPHPPIYALREGEQFRIDDLIERIPWPQRNRS